MLRDIPAGAAPPVVRSGEADGYVMWRAKKVFLGLACAMGFALIALVIAKDRWDAHYFDGYDPSLSLRERIEEQEDRAACRRIKLTFVGLPGQPVPTLLVRPRTGGGPFPCVIFVHGAGQKKEYIDEIAPRFVEAGFAVVSCDQYSRGERRLGDAGPLEELLALRRRLALTVIETQRLIDYLETRPDIAHDRVYLVGASLGAMIGATTAAFDSRIRAVVLTYGGGHLLSLFASQAAYEALGAWLAPLRYLAAYLFTPADPVKYVGGIAPRPILFQNGTRDSLVPKASAQALFDAAGEPKEITWYESDHIGIEPDLVDRVVLDAVRWLKALDQQIGGAERPDLN